jgi:hypothetical protein
MSLQFSRSLRSLNVDSYRATRVALVLASILMLALILWFFFAGVSLFETSQEVSFTEDGRLVANFPKETIGRVQPGQPATLRVYTASNQPPVNVRAVVFDVPPGSTQAELLVMSEDIPEEFNPEGVQSQVEVQVERVTPFTLVMRSSGKYIGSNQPPSGAESGSPNE